MVRALKAKGQRASQLLTNKMPEELLLHIAFLAGASSTERCCALHAMCSICKTMHRDLQLHRPVAAASAAEELVCRGERHGAAGLIKLNESNLGDVECYLLSIALSRGRLRSNQCYRPALADARHTRSARP